MFSASVDQYADFLMYAQLHINMTQSSMNIASCLATLGVWQLCSFTNLVTGRLAR